MFPGIVQEMEIFSECFSCISLMFSDTSRCCKYCLDDWN